MKKSRIGIIILLIFLLMKTTSIYAADYANEPTDEEATLTVKTTATSVKAGETIVISLSASNKTGIECINSSLKYDKNKLKLENIEMKNNFENQSEEDAISGEYIITASNTIIADAPKNVEFAELTFSVLDTVKEGEKLNIEFINSQIIDFYLEISTIENKTVTVTVIKETEKEEKTEQEPEKTEQKPEKLDNTIAKENINQAGIENYFFILILPLIVVAVVCYKKNKKYSGIY